LVEKFMSELEGGLAEEKEYPYKGAVGECK
jgi:hypothetical protein